MSHSFQADNELRLQVKLNTENMSLSRSNELDALVLDVQEATMLLNKSVGKIPFRVTAYVLICVLYVLASVTID